MSVLWPDNRICKGRAGMTELSLEIQSLENYTIFGALDMIFDYYFKFSF